MVSLGMVILCNTIYLRSVVKKTVRGRRGLFPESDVEEQHESEAENGARGGEVAGSVMLGLREHLLHNDKDDSACGKRERERQQRLNDHHDCKRQGVGPGGFSKGPFANLVVPLHAIEKNIRRLNRRMFDPRAFFYLNSLDAAFIEDDR